MEFTEYSRLHDQNVKPYTICNDDVLANLWHEFGHHLSREENNSFNCAALEDMYNSLPQEEKDLWDQLSEYSLGSKEYGYGTVKHQDFGEKYSETLAAIMTGNRVEHVPRKVIDAMMQQLTEYSGVIFTCDENYNVTYDNETNSNKIQEIQKKRAEKEMNKEMVKEDRKRSLYENVGVGITTILHTAYFDKIAEIIPLDMYSKLDKNSEKLLRDKVSNDVLKNKKIMKYVKLEVEKELLKGVTNQSKERLNHNIEYFFCSPGYPDKNWTVEQYQQYYQDGIDKLNSKESDIKEFVTHVIVDISNVN